MGRRKKDESLSFKELDISTDLTKELTPHNLDRGNWLPAPQDVQEVPEGTRTFVLCAKTPPNVLRAKRRRAYEPTGFTDKRSPKEKKTTPSTEIVIDILNRIPDVIKILIGNIKHTYANERVFKLWIKNDVLHINIPNNGSIQKITVYGQNIDSTKEVLKAAIRKRLLCWIIKDK